MTKWVALLLLMAACGGGTLPTTTSAATTTTATSTTSMPAEQTVKVYFGIVSPVTCSEVTEYERAVPGEADPVSAAFEELLKGPIPEEEAAGATSWFSDATASLLNSVSLEGNRLAVDFADFSSVIPNASSSCGSAALLAELTTTAFQFDQVDIVAYSFDGSCEAFGAFLQMGCVEISRVG